MKTAFVLCGALAREVVAIVKRHGWDVQLFGIASSDHSLPMRIAPHVELCPLFRDVFQFHWRDECQHVILDELEWKAEHQRLSAGERDRAVDDLIALVAAVDGVLQTQSASDAAYFCNNVSRLPSSDEARQIEASILAAYGGGLPGTAATYYGNYHGTYEPPFCHAQARALFNTVK